MIDMLKKIKNMDKPLLLITILLFLIGLVMVFSASNVNAYMKNAVSPIYYFIRQGTFLLIGFVLSILMIVFDTKTYGRLSKPLLFLNIIALVTLLVYGTTKNQAVSWFEMGHYTIQPSEFVKVITIVYLADYYDRNKTKLNGWVKSLFPIGITIGIAALIFVQPDLGTAIIYGAVVAAIFFAVPISKEIKWKIFFIGIAVVSIGIASILGPGKKLLQDRQMERFEIARPCDRILENGSQVCNCYIAINNGGLTGVGLGNSTQKYLYLPEPYTDFIFAIIVEELGIIVGIVILILYMIVLQRILVIGRRSQTNRGAIICYGTATYIFLHIAINLLGIMGLIPLTGVPLPFMSYGGSFTICLIAALTMVQRVAIENQKRKE